MSASEMETTTSAHAVPVTLTSSSSSSSSSAAAADASSTNTNTYTPAVSIFKTHFCYNCHRNISHTIRITCCECVIDGKHVVVLCGDCFSAGVSFVVTESIEPNSTSSSTSTSTSSSSSSSSSSQDIKNSMQIENSIGKNLGDNSSPSSQQQQQQQKQQSPKSKLAKPPMSHKGSHRYKVSDCLDFPVFPNPVSEKVVNRDDKNQTANMWTAQEELLLLEGILKNGMGNWKTISEYIVQSTSISNSSTVGSKDTYGSSKTPKQVEDHYWEHYMGTYGYCLPSKVYHKGSIVDTSDVVALSGVDAAQVASDGYKLNEIPVLDGYIRNEAVIRDKEKLTKESGLKKESASGGGGGASAAAAGGGGQVDPAVPIVGYELPGFMPLRQDFDFEFDNEAEALLANMEFNEEEDHPSEHLLKLQVVDIYNQRLLERENRRAFVIQRGLVDVKKIQNSERKMAKEDRDILARLKVFARFHSAEEHEALIDCIVKARRLRDQISLYQHYRKMGIKTLEQARIYESERRKKDHEAKVKRNKEGGALTSSSYVFDISNSSLYDTMLANAATAAAPTTTTSARGGAAAATGKKDIGESSIRGSSNGGGGSSNKGVVVGSRRGRDLYDGAGMGSDQDSNSLSMKDAPGGDLLTNKEISLCETIGVLPRIFLAMKDAIVREWFRNGQISEEGISRLMTIDSVKTRKIYDFFVKEVDLSGVDNALCLSSLSAASASSSSMSQSSSSQAKQSNSNNNSNNNSQMSGASGYGDESPNTADVGGTARGGGGGNSKKKARN